MVIYVSMRSVYSEKVEHWMPFVLFPKWGPAVSVLKSERGSDINKKVEGPSKIILNKRYTIL